MDAKELIEDLEWYAKSDVNPHSALPTQGMIDLCKKAADVLKAAAEQEPVAWGVPNTRPTERQPFMQVLLDISSVQYPQLLTPLYTYPIASEDSELAALRTAALDFIEKVETGRAKSVKSYAAFKAALALRKS